MKLDKILTLRGGDQNCKICNSVGFYFDEIYSNQDKVSALSLCSCVEEFCKSCGQKGKAPFLKFDEAQNKMMPCLCHEARKNLSNYNQLFQNSNIPPKYRYKLFENLDTKIDKSTSLLKAMDWAETLVKKWYDVKYWLEEEKSGKKKGMYLTGNTGSGKTMLACIILNELIFKHKLKCMYAKISKDFLSALKDTYQRDSEFHGQERNIEMEFLNVDVLVIDDFGVQKESDWANSKLYDLIDGRYEREKITLLTSNLPLIDWKEKGQGRVYSRLLEMTNELKLECPDYREKFVK
jgi:DNA replication protein DnaC